jgi:RNA polymerase sigma factor (sigma-70 family)
MVNVNRWIAAFARPSETDTTPDCELLQRYAQQAEQAAFSTLVQRHGPMVFGLCQRQLRDYQAAEDAFQAVFMVLAKKACHVRWQRCIGGWLHEVAMLVCRKVRTRLARRLTVPMTADVPAHEHRACDHAHHSWLDDELHALPRAYRDALVLCYYQGKPVEAAARELGCTVGQLRGRLYRGRERLRLGFEKRCLPCIAGATLLATVPKELLAQVSQQSLVLLSASTISVSSLTREVLFTMVTTKLKPFVAATVLLGGLLGSLAYTMLPTASPSSPPRAIAAAPLPSIEQTLADDDDEPQDNKPKNDIRKGKIKAIDASANTLDLQQDEDDFVLNVRLKDATTVRAARQQVNLADLQVGMLCEVEYDGTTDNALRVEAAWPKVSYTLKSVLQERRQIRILIKEDNEADFAVMLPLTETATFLLDATIPVGLADLPYNRPVTLEFALNKEEIVGVEFLPAADDIQARVLEVDTEKKSVLLAVGIAGSRYERKVPLSFNLASDAKIRKAGKDIALSDLTRLTWVNVSFAADRRTITTLLAGETLPNNPEDDD